MSGLVYQHDSCDGYRFGFNNIEGIEDISYGAYDFGNRILYSRIGRWFSIDPMYLKFPEISGYTFGGNFPIAMIDIEGNDIINGSVENLAFAKRQVQHYEKENDRIKKQYGSSRKEIKKYFKSQGFEGWKKSAAVTYHSLMQNEKHLSEWKSEVEQYKLDVGKVDQLICKLEKESPNIYAEMDNLQNKLGQSVDVVIAMADLHDYFSTSQEKGLGSAIGGETDWPTYYNDGKPLNRIDISLTRNIKDYETVSLSGQDPLRHELGHANYMVTETQEYSQYFQGLKDKGIEYNGGHNENDESGKRAEEWGIKIDIEKNVKKK